MDSLQLFPLSEVIPDYQALYHAVARQIEKDFHPHVAMSEPPAVLSSEWLFAELKRMLTIIVEQKNQTLGAIIYRVDLSEKLARRTMNTSGHTERLDELTALMLKREAQKVWIRHNYRE